MKIDKILCPIDFSEPSRAALRYAVSLARDTSAKVIVTHIVEPVYAGHTLPQRREPSTKENLEKLCSEQPPVPCTPRHSEGNPVDEIIRIAREEGADAIVMGTHGRTGLTRLMMGSVAENVLRRAPCPVITVKQPGS